MSKLYSFGPEPTLAELDKLLPRQPQYELKLLAHTLENAARVLQSHGVPKAETSKPAPWRGIAIVASSAVPQDELWLMDSAWRIGVLKLQGGP